ncbi:uncharacterized protein LOC132560606 [Ylistrum balloti]|uniref:uncharacterized protein LOC132560606 n=1 Tax=Ylistrum balloti TaxID=509963 RepID=UPI002905A5F4|nr:uncharacterized protein LOC132560606 [Ylistrum balloti]
MAAWMSSFWRIMNKGMKLNNLCCFRRHLHKLQMCRRNEGLFKCFPRSQKPRTSVGYTAHWQCYSQQKQSKENNLAKGLTSKKLANCKIRPYADVNGGVRYLNLQLWGQMSIYEQNRELIQGRDELEVQSNALRNFKHLSYNQVMDTIGLCIKCYGFICHDLLKVFLETVDHDFNRESDVWNPQSVSKLMFCVYLYGYNKDKIFFEVEKMFEKQFEDFSVVEATVLMCTFNRCGKKLNSDFVINKLWSLFFSHSETLMDQRQLGSLLRQMSRYTGHLHSIAKVEALGNYGCSLHRIEDIITVIKCLTSARFHHAKFMHHLTEEIEKLAKRGADIRVKTLALLCEFVANYGTQELATRTRCFHNLSTLLVLSTDESAMSAKYYPLFKGSEDGQRQSNRIVVRSSNDSLMRFAIAMVFAGKFHETLLSQLLGEPGSKRGIFPSNLELLQTSIDIECPSYKGNRLPKLMRNYEGFEPQRAGPQKQILLKLLKESISNIVDENVFHFHHLLPYGNKVLEIRLDEERRPTQFDPVPYSDLPSTFKNENTGIVIIPHNMRQTTSNGGSPLGMLKLQIRHCKKLGYQVIEVQTLPYKDAHSENAVQNMTEMLRKKLELDCNVVLDGTTAPT